MLKTINKIDIRMRILSNRLETTNNTPELHPYNLDITKCESKNKLLEAQKQVLNPKSGSFDFAVQQKGNIEIKNKKGCRQTNLIYISKLNIRCLKDS